MPSDSVRPTEETSVISTTGLVILALAAVSLCSCTDEQESEFTPSYADTNTPSQTTGEQTTVHQLGTVQMVYAWRFPSRYAEVSGPQLIVWEGGYVYIAGSLFSNTNNEESYLRIHTDITSDFITSLSELSSDANKIPLNRGQYGPGSVASVLIIGVRPEDRLLLDWNYNYPPNDQYLALSSLIHIFASQAIRLDNQISQDEITNMRTVIPEMQSNGWWKLLESVGTRNTQSP